MTAIGPTSLLIRFAVDLNSTYSSTSFLRDALHVYELATSTTSHWVQTSISLKTRLTQDMYALFQPFYCLQIASTFTRSLVVAESANPLAPTRPSSSWLSPHPLPRLLLHFSLPFLLHCPPQYLLQFHHHLARSHQTHEHVSLPL
jgi:hypothetical protein